MFHDDKQAIYQVVDLYHGNIQLFQHLHHMENLEKIKDTIGQEGITRKKPFIKEKKSSENISSGQVTSLRHC
jgi:hypothetical protein